MLPDASSLAALRLRGVSCIPVEVRERLLTNG